MNRYTTIAKALIVVKPTAEDCAGYSDGKGAMKQWEDCVRSVAGCFNSVIETKFLEYCGVSNEG